MGRWFVNQGDAIRANLISSMAAAISLFVTILTPDGEYRRVRSNVPFTTNGTRVAETAVVLISTLPEGEILSLNVATFTSSVRRGAVYGQFYVIEQPTLTQGYIFTNHDLLLGASEDPGPGGGHGVVTAQGLSAPAAGADYADVVIPSSTIMRAIGFHGQLVTAVAAANREFVLKVQNSTPVDIAGCVASEIQTASQTEDYYGSPGVTSTGAAAGIGAGAIQVAMPLGVFPSAGQGARFVFKTFNIQGADQWGAGILLTEEWLSL